MLSMVHHAVGYQDNPILLYVINGTSRCGLPGQPYTSICYQWSITLWVTRTTLYFYMLSMVHHAVGYQDNPTLLYAINGTSRCGLPGQPYTSICYQWYITLWVTRTTLYFYMLSMVHHAVGYQDNPILLYAINGTSRCGLPGQPYTSICYQWYITLWVTRTTLYFYMLSMVHHAVGYQDNPILLYAINGTSRCVLPGQPYTSI